MCVDVILCECLCNYMRCVMLIYDNMRIRIRCQACIYYAFLIRVYMSFDRPGVAHSPCPSGALAWPYARCPGAA